MELYDCVRFYQLYIFWQSGGLFFLLLPPNFDLAPPELRESFWRDLLTRFSIFTKIHILKFETTLRVEVFVEQIFASLAIYRENKFSETYKILINLENLLRKIWESFSSRKELIKPSIRKRSRIGSLFLTLRLTIWRQISYIFRKFYLQFLRFVTVLGTIHEN